MVREVIWSVDAFQQNSKMWTQCLRVISDLSSRVDVAVEPVYVSSPSELRFAEGFSFPGSRQLYQAAENILKHKFSKIKNKSLQRVHILVEPQAYTMTAAAQSLSRYALRSKSDLIMVGKVSKTKVERFFMGSFAETLILQSQVPILVIPAEQNSSKTFSKILFSTDLSAESLRAYKRLLVWAAPLKSEIVLCHIVEDRSWAMSPMEGLVVGSDRLILDQALKAQYKRANQKLKTWLRISRTFGVNAQILVKRSLDKPSTEVLRIAKKLRCSSLAVATQSGAIKAKLGSVARDIVRRSALPIWVCPRKTL